MTGNNVRRNHVGMERACSKCGNDIVVTEAMVRRAKYVCSPCQTAQAVAWARVNREKKRATNRAYHSRISDQRAHATASWRSRHPEKKLAHQAVQTAIRNGALTRAPCVKCGAAKAHAHHDDYSKPLSVIWLCHAHHMEHHAMLAARGGR